MLNEPHYRQQARTVGALLKPELAPTRAAELLEQLIASGQPVLRERADASGVNRTRLQAS